VRCPLAPSFSELSVPVLILFAYFVAIAAARAAIAAALFAAVGAPALHGALTPDNIISDVLGRVQTGDVHAAVYDLTDQVIYVSYMAPFNSTASLPEMAYARPFTALDLGKLFAVAPPPA
jgi:hypothetical protein